MSSFRGYLTVNWNSDACTVNYSVIFQARSGEVIEFQADSNNTFPVVPGEMYQAIIQPFTEYGEGIPSLPSDPEQTGLVEVRG